jgi:hypothetical protein
MLALLWSTSSLWYVTEVRFGFWAEPVAGSPE